MKTTCTITWPDGGRVEGVHIAERPYHPAAVDWTGDIRRLDGLADRPLMTSVGLEMYCGNQARDTQGVLQVQREGQWPDEDDIEGMDVMEAA